MVKHSQAIRQQFAEYALIYVTAQKMKFSIKDFFIFCIFSGLEIRKNIVSWKKIHSFEF